MSELKWVKTTFGELKRFDVYDSVRYNPTEPTIDDDGENLCYIFGGESEPQWDWMGDVQEVPVWKAVFISPEREALKKIVALSHVEAPLTDQIRNIVAIATAALSLIGGSDETK